MKKLPIGAKQKALTLNLDDQIYGSFAEIGAGQEVARYFFQAGGASKTVAKTMSAYDMVFSDEIYGREKSKRYVCEERLVKMLSHEYSILEQRLGKTRGEQTKFFSFANTVATSAYGSEQPGHGWLGVRFQQTPQSEPSDFILHVVLKDNHALSQQQVMGVLGVNLIYGVFAYLNSPNELLNSLYDNIEKSRVVINLVRVTGALCQKVDNRLLNLHLVREKMTNAVMFDEKGEVVLASDHLYKKDVLVVRGSYRPPTLVNEDLLKKGCEKFSQDLKEHFTPSPNGIAAVCELSISNPNDELLQEDHFLSRVDLINAMGHKVLLSNFTQYYKLTAFFSRFTKSRIALVLGAYNFFQIFDRDDGKILSSLGQLFKENVSVYLYPYKEDGKITDLHNSGLEEKHESIIDFLKSSGQISNLDNYNPDIVHIFSRKVYEMIQNHEDGWEDLVPKVIAKMIKDKKFFGAK